MVFSQSIYPIHLLSHTGIYIPSNFLCLSNLAFNLFAPNTWNKWQEVLPLDRYVSADQFKGMLWYGYCFGLIRYLLFIWFHCTFSTFYCFHCCCISFLADLFVIILFLFDFFTILLLSLLLLYNVYPFFPDTVVNYFPLIYFFVIYCYYCHAISIFFWMHAPRNEKKKS